MRRSLACDQRTPESAPDKPVGIRLLVHVSAAYVRKKGANFTDSKLDYRAKNIPALSLARTQSALRFRGFPSVLR